MNLEMSEAESKQRLFFALWPDHGLRSRFSSLASTLLEHGGQQHHPDDLHMTLVFLGSVATEQYVCIEQVGDAIQLEPFTLYLDQVDYWERPRILFLGSGKKTAPLTALVQNLQSELMRCGFEPEKRVYKPHITLVRKAKQRQALRYIDRIEWPVSEFVLAGSSAGEKFPRYQVIRRWSL